MSNIYAEKIFKDIENWNGALHTLKKYLRIFLSFKAEEVSSNSEVETFDTTQIARRLIQLFSIEYQ